jgi:N-acetylglucosamine-6-sulfatase
MSTKGNGMPRWPTVAGAWTKTGFTLCVVLLYFVFPALTASTRGQTTEERPNFVIIISDDQRYDTMVYMPRTTSLIFDQGVTFENAYVTTSRCCPSRASILTGLYVHNHGVYTNDGDLEKATFVQALHEAGYTTGVVGKYLNSYPDDVADPPLPEFDTWNVFKEGTKRARYFDPVMNIDGTVKEIPGYQTYIIRDFAVEFIQRASQEDKPFLLLVDPFSPHLPALPAPGDETLYPDITPYRPPNFSEEDVSDKPAWLADLPTLRQKQIDEIEADRLSQIQSLHALDLTVESIVQELEQQGVLDNTVVMYLSDNGFFWGEHRLPTGKIFVYEPSIHVPFGIRFPALIAQSYVEEGLVANIDIAPTLYDLAGVSPPLKVDGRSLVSLLEGEDWRSHLLIEGWPVRLDEIEAGKMFQAIHTGRYVYVETEGDRSELYDLESDPYQLENQIDNPAYAGVIEDLSDALSEERKTIPPVSMEDLQTTDTDDFDLPELTAESATDEPHDTSTSPTVAPQSVPAAVSGDPSLFIVLAISGLGVLIAAVWYFRKARAS